MKEDKLLYKSKIVRSFAEVAEILGAKIPDLRPYVGTTLPRALAHFWDSADYEVRVDPERLRARCELLAQLESAPRGWHSANVFVGGLDSLLTDEELRHTPKRLGVRCVQLQRYHALPDGRMSYCILKLGPLDLGPLRGWMEDNLK